MDTHNITIKVRRRSDLDVPSSLDEAITMVTRLLQQGEMLEVVSVEPEGKQNKSLQWG
jgi:exosome complex RNA-binding protein Csl4